MEKRANSSYRCQLISSLLLDLQKRRKKLFGKLGQLVSSLILSMADTLGDGLVFAGNSYRCRRHIVPKLLPG